MDKIHICLDLLCDAGFIERQPTLRETYNKTLGVYNLDRTSPEMWRMIHEHKIQALFQMEQPSGIQGIALSKPTSVNDLSVLNSVIRLMAPDKDSDTPLVTWSRYRKDIYPWYAEMRNFGLTGDEIAWLSQHSAITNGICESQEGLMSLVQEERLGGNSLNFADKCRKGIAKKQGALFQQCEDEFYKNIKEKGCSEKLAHYVWDVLLKVQRGYSFNRSHCLAYSLVALQEMNLAYKFPITFWDCACLISNSGSTSEDGTSDYSKIALAIGKIKAAGTQIELPDINKSSISFTPVVTENTQSIYYGLQPIEGMNLGTVEKILEGRPYLGICDFMNRCPLNKTAMISLIKAGAFDEVDNGWAKEVNPKEPRRAIMAYYLSTINKPKSRMTLQNFSTLTKRNMIPDKYDWHKQVFGFNKYLKANKKDAYYVLDNISYDFMFNYFADECLESVEYDGVTGKYQIPMKIWDKTYSNAMDDIRAWLSENQKQLIEALHMAETMDEWEKYAEGSISAWEMSALCFYHHPHELVNVNKQKYGISDFEKLSATSEVERFFNRGGREIPMFKITRIVGTVIGKNDARSSISLLTLDGVVTVKFSREYYAMYSKQISEKNDDGKKSVKEKGWFTRGTKLMIQGYRREDTFVVKKYKTTGGHQLYKITDVLDNGDINLTHARYGMEEN